MSEWAIVSAGLVRAVAVFFGSPDWPTEPQDELKAAGMIRAWNQNGNPLGLKPGDLIVRTDSSGKTKCNYAGVGYSWDAGMGCFIAPRPFASWTLDAGGKWQPPKALPTEGKWKWDEIKKDWVAQ